jgi:hypothetical protein
MCFEYRSQVLGCIAMALRCWFRYPLPYEELPFQCILSKDSQNDFETIWRCLIRTGSIDSCYCFTTSLATVGARPLQKPFPLLPSQVLLLMRRNVCRFGNWASLIFQVNAKLSDY